MLALNDAQAHLDRGSWPEALSAVKRAQGILAGGGSALLQERIARRRADLELVGRLERIRLERPLFEGEVASNAKAATAYASAYTDAVRTVMFSTGLLTLLAAPIAWFAIGRRDPLITVWQHKDEREPAPAAVSG